MELIKLLIVFVFIVVLLGFKKPLGPVIFIATILLGILFLIPPLNFIKAYIASVTSVDTIEFILVLFFIMLLEHLMSQVGYMEGMLGAMNAIFHSKKINIAVLPAVIGLLPSAGGALFSAPLVEKSAAGTALGAEEKTFLNVYYRHIMELFFPTYPCVLLTAQITGFPLPQVVLIMLPWSLLMAIIGTYYLRKVKKDEEAISVSLKTALKQLLINFWPFLLIVILIIACGIRTSVASGITLLAVILASRIKPRQLLKIFKNGTKVDILLMVLVILVFKDILSYSGAVDRLPALVSSWPIPPYLVFCILCTFITFMTGMMPAMVAIGLPLAFLAIPGGGIQLMMMLILAGYVGNMVTPMHICTNIVSQYFHADLRKVLLMSIPPYALVYVIGIIVYNIL